MKTGVCSVTFRQFGVEDVVSLAKRAQLDVIEWGGDVHVPPGDIEAAETARRITEEAGLDVSSYGSYYKVIDRNSQLEQFEPVLESALALGTNTIRIWAGALPSEVAGDEYKYKFIEHLRSALDIASAQKVRLALEFHVNSLTDSNAAAGSLLREVDHSNLYIYWQPIYWLADMDYRIRGLEMLREKILNIHVFHWRFHPMLGDWGQNTERCSLGQGRADWARVFSISMPNAGHALIEFVAGDEPEQFFRDSEVLKTWIDRKEKYMGDRKANC